MSRWHSMRVRSDHYRAIQAQAAEQSRSTSGQLDFILGRALEQEPNTSASSGGGPPDGVVPGESGRGAGQADEVRRHPDAGSRVLANPASVPARAPVAQRIEGQTTVEEMLASCPNCAGNFVELAEGRWACEDCGLTRDPDDG